MSSKCLIITGMHRSGTSLIASYLNICGVNIGENLLMPFTDNIKGYYEDIDFLKFHRKILEKNKRDMFLAKNLLYDIDDLKEAVSLVQKKSNALWGWKDPRTTLFLDFWLLLIGSPYFLFLYRNPSEVIDSLIHRKTDTLLKINPFIAAKSWIFYNEIILDFIKRNQQNTILINIQDLTNNPQKFIFSINQKFNFRLKNEDFNKVYDKNLFTTEKLKKNISKVIIHFYRSKLTSLFRKLELFKLKLDY